MSINRMRELNQMDLKENSIFCQSCEEWLTAPIYLCNDEKNYCEPCAEELTMVKIRNWALENLLENLIYCCDYCWLYNAKQAKVLQHEEVCSFRPMLSNCCNESLEPSKMQIHLLDKHLMERINMSDNVATIEFTNNFEKTLFWGTKLNDKNFIIRIISTIDSLEINVATDSPDAQNETPFFVNCFNQGNTGKVIDFRTMFDKSEVTADKATAKLDFPTPEVIKLEIIFGQEKVSNVKLNDCPICMHPFTEKVFNCVNGHMICSDCKPKISQCAICRQPMGNAFIKLANLIPDYIIPCPNAKDGCLHRSSENVMDTHRTNCKYNKVRCIECHKLIANCKLSKHSYGCFFKNTSLKEFVYTHGYNHIFVWTNTIIGNNVHSNVQMLYANPTEASKFGFKLLYYQNSKDELAKYAVTGICHASSDNNNVIVTPNDDNFKRRTIMVFEI